MTLAVGIDVGGTKIAAGLVDTRSGGILRRARRPTEPARGPQAVLDDCVALAREVAGDDRPVAVGLGLCELVAPDGGATSAVTIDWRGTDVAGRLAVVAPARVESDVRAAALAEARLGAGRPYREHLYVTVGTGASHCLVLDGRPYAGARGHAIVLGAPQVEEVASGPAIARAAGVATAEEALADDRHRAVVDRAAAALGATLAVVVNALDPGAVVIGGGLGLAPAYRTRVEDALRARVWPDATAAALPVLPAALGPEAGIVGAALAGLAGGA